MEDIIHAQQLPVHAQCMLPYSITKSTKKASEELKHQALDFDAGYHLVDETVEIRKRKGKFEVLMNCSGLDEDVD